MSALDFLSVSRMIPKDALLGLLSGAYTLHGGVVRGAGGRIVAHLASPVGFTSLIPGMGWVANAFQAYELHQLGFKVEKISQQIGVVTQLAQAGVALSGLGLAVSIASFALINRKLDSIQTQLTRVEKDTRKTRILLEALKYAQLKAAFDTLRHGQTGPQEQRSHCLHQAKRDFGQLVHAYQKLWQDENDWYELQLLDDSYGMAMIGHALAANELGMHDIAAEDFRAHTEAWRNLARAFCGRQLLKDNPQRLLHAQYVDALPSQELFAVLDFVNDSDKSVLWLDDLRREESRTAGTNSPGVKRLARGIISSLRNRELSISTFESTGVETERPAIDLCKRLLAKNSMLDGYESHMRFLSDHGLRASEFESQVGTMLSQEQITDGGWVSHGGR